MDQNRYLHIRTFCVHVFSFPPHAIILSCCAIFVPSTKFTHVDAQRVNLLF